MDMLDLTEVPYSLLFSNEFWGACCFQSYLASFTLILEWFAFVKLSRRKQKLMKAMNEDLFL